MISQKVQVCSRETSSKTMMDQGQPHGSETYDGLRLLHGGEHNLAGNTTLSWSTASDTKDGSPEHQVTSRHSPHTTGNPRR